MTKVFGLGRRFGRFLRDPEEKTTTVQVSVAEIERIERMLEESETCSFRVTKGRASTEEERILAAWANLAIEEPSFTLEEARRLHRQGKQRTAAGI